MVGASQQLIDVHSIAAGGRVLPEHGKIRSHLAIEQGHFLQFRAGELSQTACIRLGQEGRQAVPVGPSLEDPEVGEDLRHGRKWGPEFRPA